MSICLQPPIQMKSFLTCNMYKIPDVIVPLASDIIIKFKHKHHLNSPVSYSAFKKHQLQTISILG